MKKELLTLEKVVESLEEESKSEKVIRAALPDLKIRDFDGGKAIFKIGNEDVVASNGVVENTLVNLGIPYAFYGDCTPKLQQEIFNEFASKSKREAKFISRNKNLVAMLDTNVPYVSMFAIMNSVKTSLKDSNVERLDRIGFNNVINIVTKIQTNPPKRVGDFTRGGVSIEHDVTGIRGTFVFGYMYTLRCTNGLVTEDRRSINIRKYGDGDQGLFNRLKEAVDTVITSVKDNRLPEFMKTDEIKVTDPASMVHRMSVENHISARLEQLVLDRVPEIANNTTLYDVINLITNVANGVGFNQMRRLQSLGGEVLNHTSRCPTCKALL